MSVEFVIEVKKRGRPAASKEEKEDYQKALHSGGEKIKARPQSIALTVRFFMALNSLQELKYLPSMAQFAIKYSVAYNSLLRMKANPEKHAVPVLLYSYLVEDYGVSAEWLLLGKGEMMKPNFKNED